MPDTMKFPETADDVAREIFISSDKSTELGDLRIRQLMHILPKVNSELVIEGVIMVLENGTRPEQHSQDQEFAGKILERINPKTEKGLKELLLRALKNWDKSVEQFPFWLKDNYGLDKLRETFSELELSEVEKDKLETIKWWLQLSKTNI